MATSKVATAAIESAPSGGEPRDIELENKLNSVYFEAPNMRALFEQVQAWQVSNRKRLLNLNIQREGDVLCAIALTNPTEVIITSGGGMGAGYAAVVHGNLRVSNAD